MTFLVGDTELTFHLFYFDVYRRCVAILHHEVIDLDDEAKHDEVLDHVLDVFRLAHHLQLHDLDKNSGAELHYSQHKSCQSPMKVLLRPVVFKEADHLDGVIHLRQNN